MKGLFIALTLAISSTAAMGCGQDTSSKSFTQTDKQQVDQKASELKKSIDTLGQGVTQCLQETVSSVLTGGSSDLEKCVSAQVSQRADLASKFNDFVSTSAEKADGPCAESLRTLSKLVSDTSSALKQINDSLNGGLTVEKAQSIAVSVGSLASRAQADWEQANKACSEVK